MTVAVKNCAIAVFVKTPGVTPIKTRLATSIGVDKAESFYKESLDFTQDRLLQLNGDVFFPHWAITEQEGLMSEMWTTFPALLQSMGSLGARIHSVYSTLIKSYDSVFLMGSDSPHLPIEYYMRAYNDLFHNDFVIGPTSDGGFYLFGGNQSIPQEVWLSTPYSVETTYEILTEKLRGMGRLSLLPQLFDVDTIEELKKLATIEPQFQTFL